MPEVNAELILEKISNVQIAVKRIEDKLEKDYVSQEQMKNLKEKVALLQKIVFWFVALILVAVVGGWMAVIIK